MDWPVLLRSRLVLLAAVAGLVACEPIVPSSWAIVKTPDAGAADGDPGDDDAGDAGEDGGGPTTGEDAGAEDAGSVDGGAAGDAGEAGPGDGGDGPVLGDGGVDVRMSDWSACEQGWQERNVLPLGAKGYEHFALDADGEAYLIEFTDDIVRVPTTKPWRTFPRTGWVGLPPWPGGIRVDAAGEVHLALSPQFEEGAMDVPTVFLRSSGDRWVETRMASGLVKSLDRDSQGRLHALSLWIGAEHRLMYTHGPPDALVVEDTGLRALDRFARAVLKVDAQGKAHVVYEGRPQNRIHYATNASGTWVSEVVAETRGEPYLALSPAGVPHVGWSSSGTWLSVRDAQGVWTASSIAPETYYFADLEVDASGAVHVLTMGRSGPLLYWSRAQEGWVKTVLQVHEGPGRRDFAGGSLVLDGQQRVHAMLTSVFLLDEDPKPLRRVDYYRQCQ